MGSGEKDVVQPVMTSDTTWSALPVPSCGISLAVGPNTAPVPSSGAINKIFPYVWKAFDADVDSSFGITSGGGSFSISFTTPVKIKKLIITFFRSNLRGTDLESSLYLSANGSEIGRAIFPAGKGEYTLVVQNPTYASEYSLHTDNVTVAGVWYMFYNVKIEAKIR